MPAYFYNLLGTFLIIFHFNCYALDQETNSDSSDKSYTLHGEQVAITKVNPDVDFSKYNKIQLELTGVSFRKGWERDFRTSPTHRITTKEIEKIKQRVSELFYEIFTEELQQHSNYSIVEEPGNDVLSIRAAIVDLDIHNPDLFRPRRQTVFVEYAGEATFSGGIYDSLSGDVLIQIKDHKRARRSINRLDFSTSVRNEQEARRVLRKWAKLIIQHIEHPSIQSG